jgi:hypothetical protein
MDESEEEQDGAEEQQDGSEEQQHGSEEQQLRQLLVAAAKLATSLRVWRV